MRSLNKIRFCLARVRKMKTGGHTARVKTKLFAHVVFLCTAQQNMDLKANESPLLFHSIIYPTTITMQSLLYRS